MSVKVVKVETNEYRVIVKRADIDLARDSAIAAELSAIASGESELVAVQSAADALASEVQAAGAASISTNQAAFSAEARIGAEDAELAAKASEIIAIEEAGKSSTSAGQSAASAAAAEAARDVVLANIIDPATQIEVSGNVTALEAWRNKVIIVTNDSTITIPSALFTANWTFRVIVRNGFLQIAKLGSKTFPFGNPEPLINPKSDFTIRQRGVTQEVLIAGNVISTPFEASFQTQNALAGGSNDFQVRIPFSSISFESVIVDWGDGTVQNIATFDSANTTKTYQLEGAYRIKIYGNSFFLQFNNGAERLKIGEVFSWGGAVMGATSFFGCENLRAENVKDIPYNISTSFFALFSNCINLTFIRGLNEWNVANVTNMQSAFFNTTVFNQNIAAWNVGNVTNMAAMFQNALSFNQNIAAWNVANVTNMVRMFQQATAFNQNITAWNVGNVTSFTDFMQLKTFANYSSVNYNALLIGWASRPVRPNISINFGTIRYTAAASAARAVLTGSPNFWTIIDGGI
jgi:surface protein